MIEHVGNEVDQRMFINEHDRVGRNWVLTTPNRLFPVESHTQVVLSHMRSGWSKKKGGDITRLLSKRDLRKIMPPGAKIKGHFFTNVYLL